MTPRLPWIALGVFFIFYISSENAFGKKLHLTTQKEETVSALKKSVIGNFDLKTFAKSIKSEKCRNRKPKLECAKMLKESKNACLLNRKFMSDNCILACRFCSPYTKEQKTKIINKQCKDHHAKCRSWAKNGDCFHYSVFMLDVCKKSCEICGNDYPFLSDQDERCPTWGKAGFCGIKKEKMEKLCPFSCKKYAGRRYVVKYAKPPKPAKPHPTAKPKPTKPTPRPTPPLTQDEKEDLKEANEEYAEEEETRLREKEEQRKEKEDEKVTPVETSPVLRSENPLPIPAPVLADLSVDIPSEYEGGTPPKAEKKKTSCSGKPKEPVCSVTSNVKSYYRRKPNIEKASNRTAKNVNNKMKNE